jgi:hypothetical protein
MPGKTFLRAIEGDLTTLQYPVAASVCDYFADALSGSQELLHDEDLFSMILPKVSSSNL